MKFTRSDIQEILRSAGLDSSQARKAAARIIEALADALAAGETIELRGLGTLEVRECKACMAHNPRTGEAVSVPPRRRVVFRSGRELKAALRGLPFGEISGLL
jgi:integration host factor subunit beta